MSDDMTYDPQLSVYKEHGFWHWKIHSRRPEIPTLGGHGFDTADAAWEDGKKSHKAFLEEK